MIVRIPDISVDGMPSQLFCFYPCGDQNSLYHSVNYSLAFLLALRYIVDAKLLMTDPSLGRQNMKSIFSCAWRTYDPMMPSVTRGSNDAIPIHFSNLESRPTARF
jgi:hypothetical protein